MARLLPLVGSLALLGCTPEAAGPRGQLDARGMFEQVVLPQITSTCAPCHATREPFLEAGNEYEAITKYKGGLFLTQPPELSYLLHRGEHQGPALTSPQALDILGWLRLQGTVKDKRVPVTPTVAVGPGEFFLSLTSLIDDPLARVTFKIEPLKLSQGDVLLKDLAVVAGPSVGVQIKHPRFLISSTRGAFGDPADSLSNVEVTVKPGETKPLGAGGVILLDVPPAASLALGFTAIDKVGEQKMAMCKALGLFNQTVRPTLAAPCAQTCHGGANSVATNAFDMRAAGSQDQAAQARLCLDALARTNPADAPASALVRQATPAAQGGTQNHPFKLQDPAPFRTAVAAWVAAESKP